MPRKTKINGVKNIRTADDLRWHVRHWAARMGVKTPFIQVREMSQKWASISTRGRMTLNLELIDLDDDLIEYVVVHELVHVLAPNHGKVFKSFMLAYLPDWEELHEKLGTEAQRHKKRA